MKRDTVVAGGLLPGRDRRRVAARQAFRAEVAPVELDVAQRAQERTAPVADHGGPFGRVEQATALALDEDVFAGGAFGVVPRQGGECRDLVIGAAVGAETRAGFHIGQFREEQAALEASG